MKTWQSILLGIFLGVCVCAILLLVGSEPRGSAIVLEEAPTAAPILVHINGAVQNPGVYALPTGARTGEAVQAAGGFSPEADQSAVNLAARLSDGEMLSIPSQAQATAQAQNPGGVPVVQRNSSIEASAASGPVNINSATLEELMTLPGIGETKATAIITYRKEHGRFQTIDDLDAVSGIGPATLETLRDLITVD